MFLLPVLILVVSLFLLYQGLCLNGIISLPALLFSKFTSNNLLMLVRIILSKYLVILALVGVVISVFLFIVAKSKGTDETSSGLFWGYLVALVLVALFTVI